MALKEKIPRRRALTLSVEREGKKAKRKTVRFVLPLKWLGEAEPRRRKG